MTTTGSSKDQIVLPADLWHQDAVEPGQEFEAERIDRGDDRLLRHNPPPNKGVLEWLLDCPAKGYFTPIESQSTDTL